MKVALYARVSKDEEDSRGNMQDPENQLVPLRKYCEAMGWTVFREYVDRASGGSANRPAFQEMLGDMRVRHFDLILVWALDRFSREPMANTLSYIKKLRLQKVGLRSLQESWLDTSQEGVADLLLAIFSWVAAEERKKISERTKAGLEKARREGKTLGRPKGSKDSKRRSKKGYYERWE